MYLFIYLRPFRGLGARVGVRHGAWQAPAAPQVQGPAPSLELLPPPQPCLHRPGLRPDTVVVRRDYTTTKHCFRVFRVCPKPWEAIFHPRAPGNSRGCGGGGEGNKHRGAEGRRQGKAVQGGEEECKTMQNASPHISSGDLSTLRHETLDEAGKRTRLEMPLQQALRNCQMHRFRWQLFVQAPDLHGQQRKRKRWCSHSASLLSRSWAVKMPD